MTLDTVFLDYIAKGWILSSDGDGYLVMPNTPNDVRKKIEKVNHFYYEMYEQYLFRFID